MYLVHYIDKMSNADEQHVRCGAVVIHYSNNNKQHVQHGHCIIVYHQHLHLKRQICP